VLVVLKSSQKHAVRLLVFDYHVELPGQTSERSSSIAFFIKELENIKK
jgi:hypothetical protein